MRKGPAEKPAPPISGETVREETAREVVAALNAVVGFSRLLASDDATRLSSERRARYAAHVEDGAATLSRLVAGLLGLDAAATSSTAAVRAVPRAEVVPALMEGPPDYVSIIDDLVETGPSPRVVVVDSDEMARELVAAYLDGRGYDVQLVSSCKEARRLAETAAPDLLLISVADPDGFGTARMLKARDAYLPVVFLTAPGDDQSRWRALEAGAEQLLEKPLGRHDVRARVKNLLNLRKNQRALAAQNDQLRRLQAFKEEMAALMVHDLKSPLSAIAMNLDVALSSLPDDGNLTDVRGALEDCRVAGGRLFRMIANLLDISRSEDGRLVARTSPIELRHLVAKVTVDHATEARLRNVQLVCESETPGLFDLDPDLLGRVLENLLENGLRYTRPGGRLKVMTRDDGVHLDVFVANDGPPIPAEARAHIFEKYGQASTPGATRVNRGLGLYFCRVAAEAHGGSISLVDQPGMTTCFRVRLARHLVRE